MATDFKDYYAILGVARDASADDIKQAFRKLARLYHPDVAKDKATAEERFKEINEANEVLSDPEKRKKYDLMGSGPGEGPAGFGSASPSQDEHEFHFGGTGFSDFFERYFSGGSRFGFNEDLGGGFGRGPGRPGAGPAAAQRGSDIEGDLLVTLEEAMHGALRPVSLRSLDRRTGEEKARSFTLRIPPGATDGRRIRVPGQGEPGWGGAPGGDLFLRVRHAAHPDFTTRESDVYHELDVAPWEAVLGAEVVVPTLDGTIKLRIPAHSRNGLNIRVRSRGLPKGKTGGRGDFFLVLNVVLPAELGQQERALWEQLRASSSFHPRPLRETKATSS